MVTLPMTQDYTALVAEARRITSPDYNLIVRLADAIASLERQLAEVMGERDERYIPGEFRCAKCGFTLSQFRLRASDGAIGSRDDPGEKCPNDNSPLWRVTWKERAGEHYERAVSEMQRATTAEAERDRLAARCGELERALREAKPLIADRASDYAAAVGHRIDAALQEPQT